MSFLSLFHGGTDRRHCGLRGAVELPWAPTILGADIDIAIRNPRLNAGLNLQSTRHYLVVVSATTKVRTGRTVFTGLHIRFDLQAANHGLVMVRTKATSFYIRFDFHWCISFL